MYVIYLFYEKKPTTQSAQAQAPDFQLDKLTQNKIKKNNPKTTEQTKITKTSQVLGLLREDKNLECFQYFPTFSFYKLNQDVTHAIHANYQWLPGTRSLCPPWPYKPHFSSIKTQVLGSSGNPTITTKLDSGLQPCFLYHCLLLKETLTTYIHMLLRLVEVKPSLYLHLAMNTNTYCNKETVPKKKDSLPLQPSSLVQEDY
jgi:hypothetical protein